MNMDERIAKLEAEVQRLNGIIHGLETNILELKQLAQPVQNTKILVGNLANQAKSALKLNKKKDAGYEKWVDKICLLCA